MLVANLGIGMSAPAVIGTVLARGTFQLDGSQVTGNATLLDGATVQTGTVSSALQLNGGARLQLASDSRGKVFRDRLVLERGEGQFDKGKGFRIEARSLSILPETEDSSARVALTGSTRVQVAALAGAFRVLNAKGVVVANLTTGNALEFDPQNAENSTPAKLSGCLQNLKGKFFLKDDTTSVTVELVGAGLAKELGNRVQVSGTMESQTASGSAPLVKVTEVKQLGTGCKVEASGAAAAATGGAQHAGASATTVTATTVAVVGGVAAAATVGGLAAAGKLPGQGSDSSTPISR